ncbi:DoxX family protein [Sphingomonas echinoides]|uniref:DoxX family protein n=1 Tax=Sphingomonas echinoides TaxID=59803 RepID=UPI002413B82D|nr:DoxX family protein [Sphingomonas echinoides]
MPTTTDLPAVWTPRVLSIFRIMFALLFFAHGLVKLSGFPAGAQPGHVALLSLFGIAGLFEFVGGAFLTVGLFTRPVAILLCGEMAVAYFLVHAPQGFFPSLNGGELAILYCFAFLYLGFAGAGPWSIDAVRRRAY